MKNRNPSFRALLSPRKTAQAWRAQHAVMDLWLTRAMIWLSFVVMTVSRQ